MSCDYCGKTNNNDGHGSCMFCGGPLKGSYRVQKHGYGTDSGCSTALMYATCMPSGRLHRWDDDD